MAFEGNQRTARPDQGGRHGEPSQRRSAARMRSDLLGAIQVSGGCCGRRARGFCARTPHVGCSCVPDAPRQSRADALSIACFCSSALPPPAAVNVRSRWHPCAILDG